MMKIVFSANISYREGLLLKHYQRFLEVKAKALKVSSVTHLATNSHLWSASMLDLCFCITDVELKQLEELFKVNAAIAQCKFGLVEVRNYSLLLEVGQLLAPEELIINI